MQILKIQFELHSNCGRCITFDVCQAHRELLATHTNGNEKKKIVNTI